MGEIADEMIKRMIEDDPFCNPFDDDYVEKYLFNEQLRRRTATEVAEELFGKKDQNLRKAKDINKGVIQW